MMSKPKMIERAKNFSLVVLFLSTVLLLYFFWGNISFDSLRSSNEQPSGEIPEIAAMLKPDRLVVNIGKDNYTVLLSGDIWSNESDESSFVNELGRFGPAENVLVEEITYAQYQQVKEFKSIWAEFNYNIPLPDFCTIFHMKKPLSYDVIETVTAIGYSTAEDGRSLFVHDGKNQKYYRLVADYKDTGSGGSMELSALIDEIGAKEYHIYYPISSLMGVEKNTLIPLAVQTNLMSFPYRQDTYSYQTDKISVLAEQFFGRNMDFVRTIKEENGTVIYMYGYGQNVLIVNIDGSVEYKEEQSGGGTEQGFISALETAVEYVASHGSWESLNGAELTPYLKNVQPDPEEGKGYRFVFGMEVNGNRLFYETGDPIIVDVISGQVTYYKRHLIDFDQEDIEAITAASFEEAFSAVNLIAQNLKYIHEFLVPSGEVSVTDDSDLMLKEVASMINSMQIGYLKNDNENSTEIKPVWAVTLSEAEIYFDLYTAEPVGLSAD